MGRFLFRCSFCYRFSNACFLQGRLNGRQQICVIFLSSWSCRSLSRLRALAGRRGRISWLRIGFLEREFNCFAQIIIVVVRVGSCSGCRASGLCGSIGIDNFCCSSESKVVNRGAFAANLLLHPAAIAHSNFLSNSKVWQRHGLARALSAVGGSTGAAMVLAICKRECRPASSTHVRVGPVWWLFERKMFVR